MNTIHLLSDLLKKNSPTLLSNTKDKIHILNKTNQESIGFNVQNVMSFILVKLVQMYRQDI